MAKKTHSKKKKKKKRKKNMAFNVGFQPYADHDIYRAIIFFNYMTFVEHIFNSYQGGPYSPTVHITPNSPTQGSGCESKENPDFEAKLRDVNSAAWFLNNLLS